MEAPSNFTTSPETPLQLLLFVDKRPSSGEKIRQIRNRLNALGKDYPFDLQIIDVGDQPHLVEHFKLVATPALIKYHPEPRHILAGSDIVAQLDHWWSRWQQAVDEFWLEQRAAQDTAQTPDVPGDGSRQPNVPKQNPMGFSSISHITEITQLSDEIFRLKQQNDGLQEQLKFKDRLIAMLAHDLRNPLTAVSIALETLEMGFGLSDDGGYSKRFNRDTVAQVIRHARTQAKALDRMIADVLQAARGSGERLEIQPKRIDLAALCNEVLRDQHKQVESKGQRIKTDIPGDLPNVYADPERVRQVLTNLLDNAIKYTPIQGTIQLSVLHRTTQKVQVSICDTGPGIPEENRDRIFEDRYRLKRDESKDGYGIGLALCQRIVQVHYGQIWVDSELNQGSCFHFTLPV
ncbi:MAG: histidine kinase, partial [Cyanobacteria bacterium J06638_22]